jgi:hypothetical protein
MEKRTTPTLRMEAASLSKYLYLFTNRHDVISKKDFNFHKHYCALVNSHMYFNIIFPYTYISLTFTISDLGCVFIVCSMY